MLCNKIDSNKINMISNYYASYVYSKVFTFYEEPIDDVKEHQVYNAICK